MGKTNQKTRSTLETESFIDAKGATFRTQVKDRVSLAVSTINLQIGILDGEPHVYLVITGDNVRLHMNEDALARLVADKLEGK